MGRVEGKVAIVTGAASGMGEASAKLLARQGAVVVVSDLQADKGRQVAESIRIAGGRSLYAEHDVTSEAGWQDVMSKTLEAFGGLHILVNNAGVGAPFGSVEDLSLDDWRKVMAVNMEGVFLGTKYGIEAMRKSGKGGSIVNFSSTMGLVGSPSTAAYVASKGGVRLFSKSAALHCAKERYGIRVNSIHPGWIRTPMSSAALDKLAVSGAGNKAVELTPLGRVGEPEDVAYGVLYLASDESGFVTGTELVIDGGYTAQ
ncbi:NAD(P)-dependent dehydrogenase (short-subunit alcohol dehydrogenase family) [Aminobacter aminovorans]|uniref:Cyclopentanol dehydrogenase n=1 Tax=Aminobacter aminovorans TaxID=83263 RepID=A0A380WGY5_AMIAI|nr:glucose 1-dehydrogenase [Aminobacter aminovorans]TCS26741.1 NAD(P)-dependent dehydrogenase (short-subunit alcohol dehydrogenase family) [Aminobacter aminovorans]SUU88200.1 Cyclopentanol dehydrogenase [Aminobacter aminovorans]